MHVSGEMSMAEGEENGDFASRNEKKQMTKKGERIRLLTSQENDYG